VLFGYFLKQHRKMHLLLNFSGSKHTCFNSVILRHACVPPLFDALECGQSRSDERYTIQTAASYRDELKVGPGEGGDGVWLRCRGGRPALRWRSREVVAPGESKPWK